MRTNEPSSSLPSLPTTSGLALLVTLSAAGCEQGTAQQSAPSTGATTLSTLATASGTARPKPTATAATAVEALRAPDPRAYDAPEESKLGTLPEGVGLAVGSTAPDFELPDAHGKPVQLSKLTADGTVLLAFYRGGW